MKKKLQKCPDCGEETWHMVGRKQATDKSKAYTRRITSKCTVCGRKEINNMKTGKRVITGKNKSGMA